MQAIARTAPASHDHAAMARTMPGDSRPDHAVVPIVGNQARLRALARTALGSTSPEIRSTFLMERGVAVGDAVVPS